uniref:Wsv308-like protein n=1 Tax=Trachysalambria curvirostris nimavirus TaxID=2984282 RepID=A0A9C7CEA0_9VIRU|nr:MAG: wsv308-like protein [Trachysalambria curvirostris nimavirus]
MAVSILENYMKATSAAVLKVASSIEKLWEGENGTTSRDMAAALSVALYGAPPKPTVGDVAGVLSYGGRRPVCDASLAKEATLAVSAARYGIDSTRSFAESAANQICRIMGDAVPTASSVLHGVSSTYSQRRVFIGLDKENEPTVDCSKYKMDGNRTQVTQLMFESSSVLAEVEKNLGSIFSKIQNPEIAGNLKNYVKQTATNKSMGLIVSWGDRVETKLIESEGCTNNYSVSWCARDDIHSALVDIMRHVGKSYCLRATQLTSASDIASFKKAIDTCYNALMAETHERIICNVLFYANFKVVEMDPKMCVRESLGAAASTQAYPTLIKRRTPNETLFFLCFLFKIMPPDFVHTVLTFPMKGMSYHGRSGTRLGPLLSSHDPHFQEFWVHSQGLLDKRSDTVTRLSQSGVRCDAVDATANLTGPVYVLVMAVANSFQAQRACSLGILQQVETQYRTWNKFVQG